MSRQSGLWVALLVLVTAAGVRAQITLQPTPLPMVTAENETWYLAGEPITYYGDFYYPAGPQVHFSPQEMVRSGEYRGIPLYALKTIEPYSKVFVPLPGGLMQPFERRRAGALAGTVGSTAPSFPVILPAEQPAAAFLPQAPAPPMLGSADLAAAHVARRAPRPDPVATMGSARKSPAWGPLRTAQQPEGLNGIFIVFRDRRWFSSGPAEELDPGQFARIGEHDGFPVYTRDGRDERTIYVPATASGGLIVPYSLR